MIYMALLAISLAGCSTFTEHYSYDNVNDIALQGGHFKVAFESTEGFSSYNIFVAPSAHQAPSASKRTGSGTYVSIWDEKALNNESVDCASTTKWLYGRRASARPYLVDSNTYFIEEDYPSKTRVDIQREEKSVMHWSCDSSTFGHNAMCLKLTSDRRYFLRINTIHSVQTLKPVLKLDDSFQQFMSMADDWPYSDPELSINKALKNHDNGLAIKQEELYSNSIGAGVFFISDDLKRIVRLPRRVYDGVMALVYHTDTKATSRIVSSEFADMSFNKNIFPKKYSEDIRNKYILYQNNASNAGDYGGDYFVYMVNGESQPITFNEKTKLFFAPAHIYWDVGKRRFLSVSVDGSDVTVFMLDYGKNIFTERHLCSQ